MLVSAQCSTFSYCHPKNFASFVEYFSLYRSIPMEIVHADPAATPNSGFCSVKRCQFRLKIIDSRRSLSPMISDSSHHLSMIFQWLPAGLF